MEDFASVLDQLNTTVFDSSSDVLELLDSLYEEGLTVAFKDDGPLIVRITDFAG
ncbi:MAG: hypothetical protein ACRDHZ_06015 [Ktedonobacteraceae bacterium]